MHTYRLYNCDPCCHSRTIFTLTDHRTDCAEYCGGARSLMTIYMLAGNAFREDKLQPTFKLSEPITKMILYGEIRGK